MTPSIVPIEVATPWPVVRTFTGKIKAGIPLNIPKE
jgi:hypothetical protein